MVAISAFGDRNSVDRMRAAGIVAYLVKGKSSVVEIISTIESAGREPGPGIPLAEE